MQAKIAIADAHPVFRLGIRSLLEITSDLVLVTETEDPSEAVRVADGEKIDVLLLGMNLPRSESINVARLIHQKDVSTRIIVLSAFEEDRALLFEMLAWRVAAYVSKTETPEHILGSIRRCVLGVRGWISPNIEKSFLEDRTIPVGIEQTLTKQEKKILRLLGRGFGNRQIASTLFISEKTVKNHITNIYQKLSINRRDEAIAWVWKHGLIQDTNN